MQILKYHLAAFPQIFVGGPTIESISAMNLLTQPVNSIKPNCTLPSSVEPSNDGKFKETNDQHRSISTIVIQHIDPVCSGTLT